MKRIVGALLIAGLPWSEISGAASTCERNVYFSISRRRLLVYGINALAIGYGFHVEAQYKAQKLDSLASGAKADSPGAKFLQEAAQTGLVPPEDAAQEYLIYQEELKNHLLPLRKRIHEFVENHLWTLAAAVTAEELVNKLASDTEASFETEEELKRRLTSYTQYSKLVRQVGSQFDFTLQLWLTPRLRHEGKSDVHWLKLGADNELTRFIRLRI